MKFKMIITHVIMLSVLSFAASSSSLAESYSVVTSNMQFSVIQAILDGGGKVYFDIDYTNPLTIYEPFILSNPVEIVGKKQIHSIVRGIECPVFKITGHDISIRDMTVYRGDDAVPGEKGAFSIVLDGNYLTGQDAHNVFNIFLENIVFEGGGLNISDSKSFYANKLYIWDGEGIKLSGSDVNKGCLDGTISNVTVTYSNGMEITGFCDLIRISNFNISEVRNSHGSVYIHDTSHTGTMTFDNIYVCKDSLGKGFFIEDAKHLKFNNCYSETGAERNPGAGFTIKESMRIALYNCGVVKHSKGYWVLDSSYITFQDCYAHDNSEADYFVFAQNDNCRSVRFGGCLAYKHDPLGTNNYGFYFAYANGNDYSGIYLRDCISYGHKIKPYSYNPNWVTFDNCSSTNPLE